MICFWVIKNAAEKPDDFRLSAYITTLALPRWLFVEYWWSLISSSHLLCLKLNSFWMKMYFILLWFVSSKKKKKKKLLWYVYISHLSHTNNASKSSMQRHIGLLPWLPWQACYYIYSKSQEEHHEHLRIVFQSLRGKKLNAKLKSYANQGYKLTCPCIKDLKASFVWWEMRNIQRS